ncbi:hypothetical protein I7I53_00056 [Histoplasma capsulatum var. duboisii H88]|uniref:Uncharacterized protein n=1 Tax=Ajellomyces capsulatus (strain H88) TaxID=544711 RepID=A0A8A1LHH2_AJEC8|nr:hypothetical protein I7I53_00056 [Histoplasma capsulatum var. duboisii H88]
MVCLPDVHEESHLCFASEAQVTLIRAPTIILGTNLRCRFDGQTSASWRPLQQPNKTARSCAQITHDPREVEGQGLFSKFMRPAGPHISKTNGYAHGSSQASKALSCVRHRSMITSIFSALRRRPWSCEPGARRIPTGNLRSIHGSFSPN